MFDLRGLLIRLAQRAGFIYEYDWLTRKGPQAQAIRTKSRSLQFAGLEADRAQSRGAMGDYIIKLVAPGENAVPVDSEGEVSRNDWIEWAEACWTDIRETDTVNYRLAKGKDDTRHICPLQLSLIDRLVRLYSNPGEIVMDPFSGVGSTGVIAVKRNRRYFGIELKKEYYDASLRELASALAKREEESRSLLDLMGT